MLAPLPASVPRSSFGRGVQALVVQLTGVLRLSRSETARFREDAFGVEMSVGSVAAIERRQTCWAQYPA